MLSCILFICNTHFPRAFCVLGAQEYNFSLNPHHTWEGGFLWSTGKGTSSGQWDEVAKVTQQVSGCWHSHSAQILMLPSQPLFSLVWASLTSSLILRTVKTVIISYFWWAPRGCLRTTLISPCFACSVMPGVGNGRFLPKFCRRGKVQGCGRWRGLLVPTKTPHEGKKHILQVKTLQLGLKLTPTIYITVFLFNQCSATRISYIQSSERAIKMLIKNS